MENLISIRLKSFGWSVLSLLVTTLIAVFLSPEFKDIVYTNFGDGTVGMFILLLVTEGIKHLRNLQAIKKLGSVEKVILI